MSGWDLNLSPTSRRRADALRVEPWSRVSVLIHTYFNFGYSIAWKLVVKIFKTCNWGIDDLSLIYNVKTKLPLRVNYWMKSLHTNKKSIVPMRDRFIKNNGYTRIRVHFVPSLRTFRTYCPNWFLKRKKAIEDKTHTLKIPAYIFNESSLYVFRYSPSVRDC